MKKKYKRAGTTSERQDYRKGGQVSKDGPRQKFVENLPTTLGLNLKRRFLFLAVKVIVYVGFLILLSILAIKKVKKCQIKLEQLNL